MLKQLEVGEGVVDRKPSITITLSSDGEADDDEEAVVVGENSNRWLTKQEAGEEVGEVEQEVEELLEVAKEDITARLEQQVDDNKVEEEGNMSVDTNNKIEEGEGVEQGDSDGAKASPLALLGKLATTLSSNENSEDPVEAQQTENNEKTADLIEEKTEKEYEKGEGKDKASSEDKAQVVDQDLDK